MPFIDMGDEFADTKEPELAPEDTYDLRCEDVDHITEGGKNNIRVRIRIEGGDFQPIFHYLALPQPDKDKKRDAEKGEELGTTSKWKMLMTKRFLHAFGVPYEANGFDPNDIMGASARLGVTQDSFTREDGSVMRNNKIQLPPLPHEDTQPTKGKGKAA